MINIDCNERKIGLLAFELRFSHVVKQIKRTPVECTGERIAVCALQIKVALLLHKREGTFYLHLMLVNAEQDQRT
jgi:hypothetical protein